MKDTTDDTTCSQCGQPLESPFAKQRGVCDSCREKSGGRQVEK